MHFKSVKAIEKFNSEHWYNWFFKDLAEFGIAKGGKCQGCWLVSDRGWVGYLEFDWANQKEKSATREAVPAAISRHSPTFRCSYTMWLQSIQRKLTLRLLCLSFRIVDACEKNKLKSCLTHFFFSKIVLLNKKKKSTNLGTTKSRRFFFLSFHFYCTEKKNWFFFSSQYFHFTNFLWKINNNMVYNMKIFFLLKLFIASNLLLLI